MCCSWNEQHGTLRSLYDAVGDRLESKTGEAHRLMGAEHDQIRGVSSCVQQNHARDVALLNADPHWNVLGFCTFTQRRQG